MKLNNGILENLDELRGMGYSVPEYDVKAMRARTRLSPQWVHFGPGNIFRAHIARAHQELLNRGEFGTGIIAFTSRGSETISAAYAPHDNLCLCALLKASGSADKYLLASVAEAHTLEGEGEIRAREIFASPTLMLCTFTITEKGYSRASYAGENSMLGEIANLLRLRMHACGAPIALVSMDNCSKNGDKLKSAILDLAIGDAELTEYIEEKVSFPWTMIDKITPRPDPKVQDLFEKDGFEGIAPAITGRGTYVAPFVNAEEKEYLVIEDSFPNGRPPLEKAGMYFADRETVSKVEKTKVTVCLNPLHTALAIFGCLLGYDAIWKETSDPELSRLIRLIGYDEGLPVAPDPGIFTPKKFLDEVVNDRLPNPYLPDTPQRIATDTSQKMAVRFGETIRAHMARGDSQTLIGIPLVLAGYLRYLDGVDDTGKAFTPSADPRLAELKGKTDEEILDDETLFGVSLKEAGLRDKALKYLAEMRAGNGAVRKALQNLV